jgi:hypothetical protein
MPHSSSQWPSYQDTWIYTALGYPTSDVHVYKLYWMLEDQRSSLHGAVTSLGVLQMVVRGGGVAPWAMACATFYSHWGGT